MMRLILSFIVDACHFGGKNAVFLSIYKGKVKKWNSQHLDREF